MSTDNLHDDAEFERFLAGEDALSRQLKGLAQAEPPVELDAAVFAKIEAAMAAEKVRQVETGPASNDPVGPPPVSQRKRSLARSLAHYWHWPVGVAAGILAVLAYRTAFEPYHPETVALNDTNMRVIAPTPHVAAPADVVTEPPDAPSEPLSSAPPVAAQPAAAVASVREVPASANAPRADESVAEIAVSGVRPEARKPSVRFNVNDAGERAPASEAGKLAAKEADKKATDDPVPAKPESGVELARTHDPAQDVRDSLASSDSRAKLSDAPAAPPPPPPAAMMAAPPPVAALAPTPARERFGLNSPSAPSTGFTDARTVTSIAPLAERQAAAADTQEKQRERAAADQAHANPRKWLALIEKEIKDKDNQAALAEWDKFVAAYPAYKVNNKLRADIEALRAQSPAPSDAGK